MASELFHLLALTRTIDPDTYLAEALGLPEISALGSSESDCLAALRVKAIKILEDPE